MNSRWMMSTRSPSSHTPPSRISSVVLLLAPPAPPEPPLTRVESDAGVELFLEADITLDVEERSDPFFREVEHGIGKTFEEIDAAAAVEGEQAVAAKARETGAQLGLENHDQRERQHRRRAGDDPLDHLELDDGGNQRQHDEDGPEADEDLRAPGGPEGAINLIDAGGEEKDLNAVPPVLDEKFPHDAGSTVILHPPQGG